MSKNVCHVNFRFSDFFLLTMQSYKVFSVCAHSFSKKLSKNALFLMYINVCVRTHR